MKREIKFRGKKIETGEWVIGELTGTVIHIQSPWVDHIYASYEWWGYQVHMDTIGQFTYCADRNNNKIFEGDILEDDEGYKGEVKFGLHSDEYGESDCIGFYIEVEKSNTYTGEELTNYRLTPDFASCYFVTGNIHENG